MLRVGERVGGYEIVAKLRSGGMATLFLALKVGASGFRRHVAVKVVHEHLANDPDFIRMFVDEALLQARIQNPHVVHVEELGEADGNHFLVMEYVHGCSLSQLLVGLAKRRRRLTPELAVSIAMQVAAGLHAAHELRGDAGEALGVVHRDVSPQNVLLSRDGHVKLIDFGVAKASNRAAQTTGASIKGKLRYMPPEQAFGAAIDRRADVYALGIVVWEMLTMRKLFHAQDDLALLEMVRDPHVLAPSVATPGLSPELDPVVLKALAPRPEDRYATAQEFRRALGEALPRAVMIDPQSLAELIEAVVGEELEKERLALPPAVSAAVGPAVVLDAAAEDIVLTMTISAAGLSAEPASSAGPISRAVDERAVATHALGPLRQAPTPTTRAPVRVVAAVGLVVLTLLAAAGWALLGRGGPSEPIALALPPAPEPTGSAPSAPPIPVAPAAVAPVAVAPVAVTPVAVTPVAVTPVPPSPPEVAHAPQVSSDVARPARPARPHHPTPTDTAERREPAPEPGVPFSTEF